MLSLDRMVMEPMENAKPLDAPFKRWKDNDALLYRGAVSVLASAPGQGKTITALNVVNNIEVPTLYFSNDSTKYTILSRAFSLLSEQDISISREIIETRPEVASRVLRRWRRVKWDFNTRPTVQEIALHGDAFRELYGEYPHLVIVDILMNVDHEGISEQNFWKIFPELKEMAGDWQSAFLVVHHTSEAHKGNPCPPSAAIMGKANQLPELIITQAIQGDKVHYAVVKNRNGASDPSGETSFTQPIEPSKFKVREAPPEVELKFHDGPNVPAHKKINPQDQEEEEW